MAHIALFISSLQKGGSERVMVNLADYFVKVGHRVTLVTQYQSKDEYPLPKGVKRIYSEITEEECENSRIGNFRNRFLKLHRIWQQEKPEVILSFIGKNNMMAVLTAIGTHIPVVVSVRGEPCEEYPTVSMRFLSKWIFRGAAGIVMQTKENCLFFPKKLQNKTVVLKNPLNQMFICPLYEGERSWEIVSVGRLDENKNHRMLIEAFAQIVPDFPQITLTIYGEGTGRVSLETLISQRHLEARVSLPGSTERVAEKIEKAAVFVLCSNSEGVPNTLLEAMALGLPCIATDCRGGGVRELIEDGKNGLLVPVGDCKKLAEAMEELLIHREKAEAMGKEAYKVQKSYHPLEVSRAWEKYLEGIIDS